MEKPNPINPTDDDALALAARLCRDARFGALGVVDPTNGHPSVTRVAVLWHKGAVLTLISELSSHTKALGEDPRASVLIGEPGPKGDPLTHPRMTLTTVATTANKADLRSVWLEHHPKSQLYYDFADFQMMRLVVEAAALNGGFGKAYQLMPDDLPSQV